MSFVSMRRVVPACIATAAALALAVPGVASAKVTPPATDVLEQCSGTQRIEGVGSTFQAPLEFVWTGVNSEKGNEELHTGFNYGVESPLACSGTQGSGQKPVAYYNQEEINRGSGSCLKTYGEGISTFGEVKGGEAYPRVKKFPWCGTDEAPKQSVKESFEGFADHASGFEGGGGEAIESIPVAQGSEAIIIHLPKDCFAKSEITTPTGKIEKLGRLALDREVLEGIYAGTIKTWAEAIAAQGGDGHNVLECTGGAENDTIRPVVRADKSGTTHIFKAFLLQVNTAPIKMEEFNEPQGKGKPCGAILPAGEEKTWAQTSEGCENQRWPEAANVLRPTETGNPGVVNKVNETESTIGYADLAVAREFKFFSTKTAIAGEKGGENKKGSETKQGEQNKKFWAVLQDSEAGAPVTFADPATNGDKASLAESNCKDTNYVSNPGEEFPPESTRFDWSKAKGEVVSATYGICGLTYVLAARQYYYFLEPYFAAEGKTTAEGEEEAEKIATAVHDYLHWMTNKQRDGGGYYLKKTDYAKLPKNVQREAEFGAEEIGSKIG
jgi:ABC-type phosphate transport system substrate-binding protein